MKIWEGAETGIFNREWTPMDANKSQALLSAGSVLMEVHGVRCHGGWLKENPGSALKLVRRVALNEQDRRLCSEGDATFFIF